MRWGGRIVIKEELFSAVTMGSIDSVPQGTLRV